MKGASKLRNGRRSLEDWKGGREEEELEDERREKKSGERIQEVRVSKKMEYLGVRYISER